MIRKSFIKELSATFATQVIITIFGIILLKILSNILPEEGLGAYLVIRRMVGLAFPLLTLNLGMSMAKFISFDIKNAEQYFLYSFLVITVFGLILLAGLPFYKNPLVKIIFGHIRYAKLALPTLLFLYANSFQIICIGYYRGYQDFVSMNLISIYFWIESLVVLTVYFFVAKNFVSFLSLYFIVYAVVSFVINWINILKNKNFGSTILLFFKKGFKISNYKVDAKFLKYGIVRLPTGFFLAGLFFIPVATASSSISLKTAAYIGIIVSIVRMIQLLGVPFNLIFLPKFSYYQSQNNKEFIKYYSQIVLEYIFTFPFIVGLLIFFLSNEIILLWFGSKYLIVVKYLILVGPFIGLFLGYVLIRGILDGLSEFPYSNVITFNGVVCVGILSLLTIVFSWDLLGLVIAFGVGITVLGISSIYILLKKQRLQLINIKNSFAFLWFVLLFSIFFLYNRYILIESLYYSLGLKILVSLVVFVLSFLIYKRLGYEWVNELLLRLNKIHR